jgi:hypothetical protein
MQRLVFFSRCKPQDVDALQVALDTNRVFIGYPHSCVPPTCKGRTESKSVP